MSILFLVETALILIPAVMLRMKNARETPRTMLKMATLACLGGMFYRFIPTSIAYIPAHRASYFPSLPEVLMAIGYIALGIVAFLLAVKYFAVLPGEIKDWNYMFRPIPKRQPANQSDAEGGTRWPASLSTR
jgi:Ni/Fe-hydrogenase subunit HybB-like protein